MQKLHIRDVPFCVIFIFIGKISFYFYKITQKGTSLVCNNTGNGIKAFVEDGKRLRAFLQAKGGRNVRIGK